MLFKTLVAIALALSVAASPISEDSEHLEKRRAPNCQRIVHGSAQCGHLPYNVKLYPGGNGCYWVRHNRCPGNDDIKDIVAMYNACLPVQHGRCPGGENIKWVDALEGCAEVAMCGGGPNHRRIVNY